MINTTNAPSVLVKELSRILVRLATLPPVADHDAVETEIRENNIRVARSLLALVHQRHPELLRGVADDVLSEAGDPNEDRKERKKMVNGLLTSFSLVSDTLHMRIFKTEAAQTLEPPISRVQQCKRSRSCVCKHVKGYTCHCSGKNVLDVGNGTE